MILITIPSPATPDYRQLRQRGCVCGGSVCAEPAYLTNGATHSAPPPSGPPSHNVAERPVRREGGGAPPLQGDHSFTLIVPIRRGGQ